jgi:hypothetical protein
VETSQGRNWRVVELEEIGLMEEDY